MADEPPLSQDEIIRLIRKYQSPEYRGRRRQGNDRRVDITAMCAMAGVSWVKLYEQLRRGWLNERMQAVLSPILRDIEAGRIKFRLASRGRCKRDTNPDGEIEYRQPPARPPPPQPRVIRADDYNEWSRCQSCGSPHFSSFKGLAGKLHYACDGCVTEADRKMLGAR